MFGKREEETQEKSIEAVLASESDQKIVYPKMGMPVTVEFMGANIEVKSVSPHVLTIIQKIVIEHKKAQLKFSLEKGDAKKKLLSDSLGKKRSDMDSILQVKDEKERESALYDLLGETGVDALVGATIFDLESKVELLNLNARFTAEVIQHILLEMNKPKWKEKKERPNKLMLNEQATVEDIVKNSSIAEMNLMIDIFYQMNDVGTMVGNVDRLTKLI